MVDFQKEVEEYIQFVDLKKITKKSYKEILDTFIRFMKKKKIIEPTRNDILAFKDELLTHLSSASVQKYIVVIRGLFRHLKAKGVYEDITYQVRGCKVETVFKRLPLSIEDSIKLIKRAQKKLASESGKRDYALVILFLTTGIRSIEAERANVEDIDLVQGEPVLRIQGKGKDAKDEYVKLAPEVFTAIQEYLSTLTAASIQKENDKTPLFITTGNVQKRLSTRMIRGIIKELLIEIGYNSRAYSVHSLRHTFATTALLEGATLMQTQEALRHKNVSTTQIYSHMLEAMKSKTTQIVSDALFKKKEVRK